MNKRHVVIVGGGFAGLGCAQKLAGHDGVHVTLIDRNNYHQFQPLLYQVATSQLAPSDIAHSLRAVFVGEDNVDVKLTDVAEVDPAARTVTSSDGQQWSGDVLVLAAGSQPNFFDTPGAAQNARRPSGKRRGSNGSVGRERLVQLDGEAVDVLDHVALLGLAVVDEDGAVVVVRGIGEPVEAQSPRQRDHVAAIDEALAEAAVTGRECVEMHLRGVLEQARRDLMLCLFDRHAVDVIDLLANRIVGPAMGRAGESEIIGRAVDRRTGGAERIEADRGRQRWRDRRRSGR